MNERIQELEKQSYTEVMHELGGRYMAFDKEKFAELIIRECAELTLAHRNDDYYNGWLDYRDEIRRHFGVADRPKTSNVL